MGLPEMNEFYVIKSSINRPVVVNYRPIDTSRILTHCSNEQAGLDCGLTPGRVQNELQARFGLTDLAGADLALVDAITDCLNAITKLQKQLATQVIILVENGKTQAGR